MTKLGIIVGNESIKRRNFYILHKGCLLTNILTSSARERSQLRKGCSSIHCITNA